MAIRTKNREIAQKMVSSHKNLEIRTKNRQFRTKSSVIHDFFNKKLQLDLKISRLSQN
jgi:hypothetical protein